MENLESKAFEACPWSIEGASGVGGTAVVAQRLGRAITVFSSPDSGAVRWVARWHPAFSGCPACVGGLSLEADKH